MKKSAFLPFLFAAALLPSLASAITIPGTPLGPSNFPTLSAAHKTCAQNYGLNSTNSLPNGTAEGFAGIDPAPPSTFMGAPTLVTPPVLAELCGLTAAQLNNTLYVTRLFITYWDSYRTSRLGYCSDDLLPQVATPTSPNTCAWDFLY